MNEIGAPPQPNFEKAPETVENLETGSEQAVEQRPAVQESGVGKQAPQPAISTLPSLPQIPTTPAGTTPPVILTKPVGASTASDLTAQDTDLIEKQWVDRAKAIVAQTQDDPYKQKKEMSRVKAEYVQKRFNKTIKTDDAVAAT